MSTHPAAQGHKPTTEQMLALWLGRRAQNYLEAVESEVGFYEWLAEVAETDPIWKCHTPGWGCGILAL